MPNVARPLNAAMESKGTIGKQLTFYGATCDREIYDECVVASLACTTPGDFSAEVTNFSNREVASWLTSSGPVASLTINAQEFALSTSNISYSEMEISFPHKADFQPRGGFRRSQPLLRKEGPRGLRYRPG